MTHRMTIALAAATGLTAIPAISHAQREQVPARTPWGHPDLQGLWTNATLTPLQRPAELAGKEFLTPEEAASFARQRLEQTDADRPLPPGDVGSYNDAFFERGSGLVETRRTSLVIDPPDGRIPAMTPEAQRKVEARAARAELHPADGPEDRWLTERCILFGATVPMFPEPYNNLYQIVQSTDSVAVLVEMNHDTRLIPLDGRPHASDEIEQWTGDSRGRWEGDTLVVETQNFKFNEMSRFGVQYLNGLSDENLRVVERFTRLNGDTLVYRATIDDPSVYTKTWTVEIPLKSTPGPLFEVACHEGNYGLANILSGHRAEERAAAAANASGGVSSAAD